MTHQRTGSGKRDFTDGTIDPDWRNKPFGELTEAEIDQMDERETRWYLDWLGDQRKKPAPEAAAPTQESINPDDPRFDGPNIAIMDSGIRIWIYPGEHEVAGAFAGEKLPPLTDKEIRSNSYVSVFWDRSKVAAFEARK